VFKKVPLRNQIDYYTLISDMTVPKPKLQLEITEQFKDYLTLRGSDLTYYNRVIQFLTYCQEQQWDWHTLSLRQAQQYLLHLKTEQKAINTINSFITSIKAFYRYLNEHREVTDEVTESLTNGLRQLKVPRKLVDYLTKDEFEIILQRVLTFSPYIHPLKAQAVLLFFFYTGVRLGEFTNLKRKDIDLPNLKVFIRLPNKTKTEGEVYINERTANALAVYFGLETEKVNAFNLERSQVEYFVRELNKYHTWDKTISPHTFRHSFGMYLAERGVDVVQAQKLLRHKSLDNTLLYFDPTKFMVEKTYREKIK